MRRILLWSALGLSLSANATVAAVAIGNRSPSRGMAGEPPIFSRVSLDPGQRAQVLTLRKGLLADREEEAKKLAELRVRLANLLAQDRVDRIAVERTLAEIEARQAGFQRRVVSHVLAVREMLREDQRLAFFAMVSEQMRRGMPLDPTAPPRVDEGAPR